MPDVWKKVTYGDVTFDYANIGCRASSVLGPDSRTIIELLFDFTITGTIAADTRAELENSIRKIENETAKPRKEFKVQFLAHPTRTTTKAAQTLYYFVPANSNKQAQSGMRKATDWGPIPDTIDITRIAGGVSARYSWRVRVAAKPCDLDESGFPELLTGKVLGFSCGFHHIVDVNGMTTRTMRGSMVVSADAVPADGPAGRGAVVEALPGVPAGFRREVLDFNQGENPRTLLFVVVDREMVYTFPRPITNGRASFNITTEGFALYTASLSGFFEAAPNVSKKTIVEIVESLFRQKILDNAPAQRDIVWHASLTEDVYGNRIDFEYRGMLVGAAPTSKDVQTRFTSAFKTFGGKLPPGSDGTAQPIDAFGQARHLSSSDPFQADPCTEADFGMEAFDETTGTEISRTAGQQTALRRDDPMLGGSGSAGTAPPASQELPGGDNNDVSKAHLAAPYTVYHEEIEWVVDNKVVEMSPQMLGAAPVHQHVELPSIRVIQSGYATRVAESAAAASGLIPRPALSCVEVDGEGAPFSLMWARVTPIVPKPLGFGDANEYRGRWTYIMAARSLETGTGGGFLPFFPADPRRGRGESSAILDPVPQLVAPTE